MLTHWNLEENKNERREEMRKNSNVYQFTHCLCTLYTVLGIHNRIRIMCIMTISTILTRQINKKNKMITDKKKVETT